MMIVHTNVKYSCICIIDERRIKSAVNYVNLSSSYADRHSFV